MATLPMMEPSFLSPQSPMRSPTRSPARSPSLPPPTFSFLLRPENFHSLPTAVPPPFKTSPHNPHPDTPLSDLLSQGHFRAAATAAAIELTSSTLDPTNHRRIFELFSIRLTCLALLDLTNIAAQEIKVLDDLSSPIYRDDSGAHVIPWDLRVLAIKLTAIGFGDARRAVMSYYDLAREARAYVATARNDEERTLWTVRLRDLGVRVAWALIELDDVAGAVTHMRTMPLIDGKRDVAEALLWLQLGDAEMARSVCEEGSLVEALADMADGEFEKALEKFGKGQSETVLVNRAVCLLYIGQMDQASQVLEKLVDGGSASKTLLLNLSTIYELVTDKNRGLKTALAGRVAAREPDETGWERTNADFKL